MPWTYLCASALRASALRRSEGVGACAALLDVNPRNDARRHLPREQQMLKQAHAHWLPAHVCVRAWRVRGGCVRVCACMRTRVAGGGGG